MSKPSESKPAIISICAKCSDMFGANLTSEAGLHLGSYEGYVPDFFPGEHYGDYVMLDIELATGKIVRMETPDSGRTINIQMKHPQQPTELDAHGILRYKCNRIVRDLLDKPGPWDLNRIAVGGYSREDQQQFAQLIGYSVDGYSDLSYADRDDVAIVDRMHETGEDERDATIAHLKNKMRRIKEDLAEPMAALFNKCPGDLLDDDA